MTARWWERAACKGMPTALFFSTRRGDQIKAQKVCARCPVRDACLGDAMRTEPRSWRHGIWGGLTARGRDRIAGPRQREVAA